MKRRVNTPDFDVAKCNACGLCVGVCECRFFAFVGLELRCVETSDCDLCLQCEMVCPTGAITFPFEVVIEED